MVLGCGGEAWSRVPHRPSASPHQAGNGRGKEKVSNKRFAASQLSDTKDGDETKQLFAEAVLRN